MAGGGIKPGITHGETDDLGYNAASDVVHIRDLHATMLHVLGLDPNLQIQDLGGRPHYATDHGRVIHELFA